MLSFCLATIGALRFLVRGFGCALFYFSGGHHENQSIIHHRHFGTALRTAVFGIL
jgi:hypothetical protein